MPTSRTLRSSDAGSLLALARRLERTEASANAAFVDARARAAAGVGAAWIDVDGAYAMFDGVGSPLTQTFGLGVFHPATEDAFARLESFFRSRGAETMHEVCAPAADHVAPLLAARGYRVIEESLVWSREIETAVVSAASDVRVRRIAAPEGEAWARIAADGWRSEGAALADFVEGLGRITARADGTHCFLGEIDGTPVAAGAMHLSGDVALLAGASTIPGARGRGAQGQLLRARLAFAAERGAVTAMVVTAPEGPSARNAERMGFRPAYSRRKWSRP